MPPPTTSHACRWPHTLNALTLLSIALGRSVVPEEANFWEAAVFFVFPATRVDAAVAKVNETGDGLIARFTVTAAGRPRGSNLGCLESNRSSDASSMYRGRTSGPLGACKFEARW